ncbi:MAG: HAMP domain-containing protein [Oligoflexales bacterium]|nr:HAMP domain-containing protein [Oligoflexales bacterium]
MKISRRLGLIVLLTISLPALFVGVLSYYFLKSVVTERTEIIMRDRIMGLSSTLERQFNLALGTAESLARSPAMLDINIRDDHLNIAALIKTTKDSDEIIKEINVLSPKNGFISSTNTNIQDNPYEFSIEGGNEIELTLEDQMDFVKNYIKIDFLLLKKTIDTGDPFFKIDLSNRDSFIIIPIKDFYQPNLVVGILHVELNDRIFTKTLLSRDQSEEIFENFNIYLLLQDKAIFSHSPIADISLTHLPISVKENSGMQKFRFQGEKFLVVGRESLIGTSQKLQSRLSMILIQKEETAFSSFQQKTFIMMAGFLLFFLFLVPTVIKYVQISVASPLESLTAVAKSIAKSGDLSQRIRVKSQDEVGILSASFNELMNEIQSGRNKLEKYNSDLEQNVAIRTAELAEMKGQLSEMLDNMKQAVLTFDGDLLVNPYYSKYMSNVFPLHQQFSNQNIVDLLVALTSSKKHALRANLDFVLAVVMNADILQYELFSEVFPRELKVRDNDSYRYIKLTFEPIFSSERILVRMMLILEDVTEVKRLERSAQAKKFELEVMTVFYRGDARIFKQFVAEVAGVLEFAKQLQQSSTIEQARLNQFLDVLHSIKGSARLFALSEFEYSIHRLESKFAEIPLLQNREGAQVNRLNKTIESLEKKYKLFLNLSQRFDLKTSSTSTTLEGRLIHQSVDVDFQQELNAILQRAQELVAQFNSNNSSQKVVLNIDAHCTDINFELIDLCRKIVPQLVANALGHGVSDSSQNELKIKLNVYSDEHIFTLVISDNGKGIDRSSLKNKALTLGLKSKEQLNSMSDIDVLELVFLSGFSTAAQVDRQVGRGRGLSGVRNFVENLSGKVAIESEFGQGTSIKITVPLNKNETPAVLANLKIA